MHRVAANAHFSSQFQNSLGDHSHFVLQPPPDGLNSSSAQRIRASMTDQCFVSVSSIGRFQRSLAFANSTVRLCAILCALVLSAAISGAQARPEKLPLPPGTAATLDKIYSFDTDGAIADAKRLQSEQPGHPLGYLIEAEALWWKIFCTSAEFKYGMTDARHRPKLAIDQHYLELAAKASSIALAGLKNHETAEMQFYAGMGDAFAARLFGLRAENRAGARAGVHAREHFLRALKLDPELADAEFGL